MASVAYPTTFYTYGLFDPKTGVMFYAGKGQRDRAWHHAREVAAGRSTGNARKDAKIAEILLRGDQVEVQILGEYDDENDALEHEFEVVDSMPELTNIRPGGGGGAGGRRLTADDIRRRETARQERIVQARKESHVQVLRRRHEARCNRILDGYAFKGHEAEITAWLERIKPDAVNPNDVVVRKRRRKRGYEVSVRKPSRPPKARVLAVMEQEKTERLRSLDEQAAAERRNRLYPENG